MPSLFGCILLLSILGCSRAANDVPTEVKGGHLIDLQGRDEMQLELVADGLQRQLIVNVLESGTHNPFPVASKKLDVTFVASGQEIPVSLDADPRPTDPQGNASRFSIEFKALPQPLHEASNYSAKFTLDIQDQSVTGTLQHRDDHTHTDHHD